MDFEGWQVVIKEYLLNSLVLCGKGDIKLVIIGDYFGVFCYGMKCFFEEGCFLVWLLYLNVICVLNFFCVNDIVYMVMEYEYGCMLQEFIQKY